MTAIGHSKNEKENDIIYIWNAKYLNKKRVLELKGLSKIITIDFAQDENTFAVVYLDKPPVFLYFKKGEVLSTYHDKNIKHTRIFSYSFSNKGKYFAIATDKYFVSYNVKTGKIIIKIISDSPIKVFGGNRAIFIDKDYKVTVLNFKRETKEKKEKKMNI